MSENKLDCIVIGYNELPFQRYESFLSKYGEDSEAYRDLKFSFVNVAGEKMDYVGLLNHVLNEGQDAGLAASPHDLKSGDIPNLAAVYLTNFLRNRGVAAEYINLFQYEKEELLRYLAQDPVCVAITTTFYVVNVPVNEMVEFIRQHNPRVKIVVGGPLIANHARNNVGADFSAAVDDLGADIYVIEGQGEQTLYEIVECLKGGGDLNSVPNLAFFEDGQLKRTPVKAENNSLDDNSINWTRFRGRDTGRTLQTRTARSCAFKCAFCNYPTRAGALTLTSLDYLERELDSMLELDDVQNVVFIDDTFNVPFPRFKDICRMMIRKKYPFNWFSYFRCSNSDEEAIDLMAESGCKGVFLGIESGSPTILQNMNKAATIEKYAQGIEWLRARGILTFGSFILGFPGETEETVNETINFIKTTRPDYYRTQMWYCEPGTPIYHQKEKYQIEGDGFVWSHATMDSLEAMDHIDRMFLSIDESLWLPQWSFDFWIIPYLMGKGITVERFKEFMTAAHKMLALEIASVPSERKKNLQQQYLRGVIEKAKNWQLSSSLVTTAA
ncbi:MAG TPA: PhpK family radical SAM P-methyltransferase [Pyrinomonadaceae bacterium]|nr:PhpK family radical SAM P-methyltransferase [Pyrinomonadaceae bacterium]